MKFGCRNSIVSLISQQINACATTAQMSRCVHNFVVIKFLKSGLEQNEIFTEFVSQKNISEIRPWSKWW